MIRRYSPADLDGAAEVFRNAFAGEPWNESWSRELCLQRIGELMSAPQSVGYVCEKDGVVRAVLCGRILTYLHGKEYVIDEFCVDRNMQRSGIGSEILGYVREELSREGVIAMTLTTSRGYPSERFYMKNGFKANDNMVFMYRSL